MDEKQIIEVLSKSPCKGLCSTTVGDDICKGCGRTYFEVINWNSMSETEKREVIDACNERRIAKDTKRY